MTQDTAEQDPRSDLPAGAPAEVASARNGATLTDEQEKSALDWFLGATQRLEFDVTVQYDTPTGMKPLVFHLKQVDDKRIEEIDDENRAGDPTAPFRKLDVGGFNASLVAEALVYTYDPESGRRATPEEIRGDVPGLAMALQVRFKTQPGLLEGLAERIREKAGFSQDRVGTATRSVVEAGKG